MSGGNRRIASARRVDVVDSAVPFSISIRARVATQVKLDFPTSTILFPPGEVLLAQVSECGRLTLDLVPTRHPNTRTTSDVAICHAECEVFAQQTTDSSVDLSMGVCDILRIRWKLGQALLRHFADW